MGNSLKTRFAVRVVDLEARAFWVEALGSEIVPVTTAAPRATEGSGEGWTFDQAALAWPDLERVIFLAAKYIGLDEQHALGLLDAGIVIPASKAVALVTHATDEQPGQYRAARLV